MFDPSLQTIWGGNLIAVFCDTGWEHPDTYKHVNDVCLQMGVRLITLKSKYDFVSLAVHKKRFPSTNARFCTSELKMKPELLNHQCIALLFVSMMLPELLRRYVWGTIRPKANADELFWGDFRRFHTKGNHRIRDGTKEANKPKL